MNASLTLAGIAVMAAIVAPLAAAGGEPPVAPSPPAAPSAPPAAAVVMELYTFHFGHDMGFSKETVAARASWLSPELLAACRTYFAQPGDPDEVPAIDGDPFTDSQETPGSFDVGKARVAGDHATVGVTLRWSPPAESRTVEVVLVRVDGAWRVDDVRYHSGPSLRRLLAGEE